MLADELPGASRRDKMMDRVTGTKRISRMASRLRPASGGAAIIFTCDLRRRTDLKSYLEARRRVGSVRSRVLNAATFPAGRRSGCALRGRLWRPLSAGVVRQGEERTSVTDHHTAGCTRGA